MPDTTCSISTISLLLLAAAPAAAHAAGDAADADGNAIVVTALRTPVARDRVSSSITVLDQAAIEREQPIAVTDALVRTPGISVTRNGGYGAAASLRIRGADAGQSVLVIDGMRLADPSANDGGYNFATFLADDIARIEILRGPQSILWGSNAIGGVINVQTAQPEKPLEGSFAASAGSRQTLNARAGIGGKTDDLVWRIAGSTFTTDGISARSNGTEPDGYSRRAASGSAALRVSPAVTLDLRGYWADARNDFDGSSGDTLVYGLTREWTLYAGLSGTLLDGRFRNRLAVIEGRTQRENHDPARTVRSLNFDADGRSRRFEYQGTFTFSPAAELVFGAEREDQRMTSASPGNDTLAYARVPNRAHIDSLYGEARVTPIAGVTLNAGTRYDRHSRFGGHTVFSAGAAWSLNAGATVLRASYDEGFKAPSLYQLFSLYGVAGLKPEKARGWEIGAEQSLLDQHVQLSAVWFDRRTDNLIDFAFCPTTGALPPECYVPGTTTSRFGYYANVKKANARGLELAGTVRVGRAYAQGNYSLVKAEDRTPGANSGKQLARVPRHMANAEAGYAFAFGLSASAAVRYSGTTLDRNGGSTWLRDYWLADLRGEWKTAGGLALYGRIENLFDTRNETASGYGSLGRSFYLGLRGRF